MARAQLTYKSEFDIFRKQVQVWRLVTLVVCICLVILALSIILNTYIAEIYSLSY